MTATFILKCIVTTFLVGANLLWLAMCLFANAMSTTGEWDHSTWPLMGVPTVINLLILWSMWE